MELKMADDFNKRAQYGQALNLAVETACHEGKAHDTEYVLKQFLRYLEMSKLVQQAKPAQLAEILKCKDALKLMEQLKDKL